MPKSGTWCYTKIANNMRFLPHGVVVRQEEYFTYMRFVCFRWTLLQDFNQISKEEVLSLPGLSWTNPLVL